MFMLGFLCAEKYTNSADVCSYTCKWPPCCAALNAYFCAMDSDTTTSINFSTSQLPYGVTGSFSPIVIDYLAGDEKLKDFYHRSPEPEHFGAQIEEKGAHYPHRKALVEALKSQYAAARLKCPAIDFLSSPQAFTITTGHQVCLFTGPVYVVYKIVSAIKACKLLEEKYPANRFVPVFWMATEDHDFEEANHFNPGSGKLEWESGQGGAVGRMHPEGMDEVAEQLKQVLGLGYNAAELTRLFEKAYLGHTTIAAATRYLVHSLFGKYGLVCIDGDDPQLKCLAVEAFRQELFQQKAQPAVESASSRLETHYAVQAHPREVNLFYLDKELRERIVRKEDGSFEVLHTDISFSEEEMEQVLVNDPARISPNVILRPLYQEIILPNLAYIGGGGELAYWFQLKDMFAAFGVPFPILMLRNSAMMVSAKARGLMEELGLDASHIFAPVHETETSLLKAASAEALNLDPMRAAIKEAFDKAESQLSRIDVTLERSVRSGYARTERVISNLEKKMLRAEKRKQEAMLNRLHTWHRELFPGGGLQERTVNMAAFYQPYGPAFIEMLIDTLDPFSGQFTLIYEG